MSWLKLNCYNSSEVVRACADKLLVRRYIESAGLSHILVPLHGVYSELADIDFCSLPESFVLKSTVGSGANYVCRKKTLSEWETALVELEEKSLRTPWKGTAEFQYRGVRRRFLCEQSLVSPDGELPADFKFDCSLGRIASLLIVKDRDGDSSMTRFAPWSAEAMRTAADVASVPAQLLAEAAAIAQKLSKPFPFVRVDLYLTPDGIRFGELTFTPAGGINSSIEDALDEAIGERISISAASVDKLRAQTFAEFLAAVRG